MIQQHPYCRTCGSLVGSGKICHYCGCEPLQGHNYCCDCGTSTIPEAVMCVHCGASFQRKFPVMLAVLITIALVVSLAGACYFMTRSATEPSEKIRETNNTENKNDSNNADKNLPAEKKETDNTLPAEKNESGKIIINNPFNLLKNKNTAISRLIKNLPRVPKPEPVVIKPAVREKKEEPVIPAEKTTTVPERVSMNVFSPREMSSYSVGCTYFTGKSKNNVVFFTTNLNGFVKINGKVVALQGMQKGNDIARFYGGGYYVTVEILGLAGNEREWLADATLVVKDARQRTVASYKISSTCIDF